MPLTSATSIDARLSGRRSDSAWTNRAWSVPAARLAACAPPGIAPLKPSPQTERPRDLFEISNLPFLIDHEGSPVGIASLGHQHGVSLGRLACREIAEEREGEIQLLGKFTLGRSIICTDTEDLRVSAFKFGDTSLVSRHFLRSATGERGGEEGHHHVLLATELAELDSFALSGLYFEVRSRVAHLEVSFRRRLRQQQRRGEHCQSDFSHTRMISLTSRAANRLQSKGMPLALMLLVGVADLVPARWNS